MALELIPGGVKPEVNRFVRIILEEWVGDGPALHQHHLARTVTELHMKDAVVIVADGPNYAEHRSSAAVFHVRDGEVAK